jgi:hypothetical protein
VARQASLSISSKKHKFPVHYRAHSSINEQRCSGEHERKKGAGSDRDMQWVEQLLNLCTTAVESSDLSRVQHLVS